MDMSDSLPPIQPTPSPAPDPQTSTRSWEVLCHLSSLVGLLGVPFGNIIGPLIVWLVKRDASPGVDAHGKESLNFHISWTIYGLVLAAIAAILMIVVIGIFLWPVLILGWIAMLILVIIGSVKAGNGELYRYPLTIRFLN
jgi:uncharacterized Tic20 family protein